MQGSTYLVLAYIAIWLGVLIYAGWLALRQRGISIEVESLRQLAERHDQPQGTTREPADA